MLIDDSSLEYVVTDLIYTVRSDQPARVRRVSTGQRSGDRKTPTRELQHAHLRLPSDRQSADVGRSGICLCRAPKRVCELL